MDRSAGALVTDATSTLPRAGAVLVAAGRGERLGAATPKQFLPLAGRPLFTHSLELFERLEFVVASVLVVPPGGLPEAHRGALEGLKAVRCVEGGARRQDSVAAGLAALVEKGHPPIDVVLVHDVARPFPDPEAIAKLARVAMKTGGGLLAVRAADTVKRATSRDVVDETLDRNTIWLAQTPQAIRADLLPRAIEELRRPDVNVTDEAALLERWGVEVALVESSSDNFKITHPADFTRAEAVLAARVSHSS